MERFAGGVERQGYISTRYVDVEHDVGTVEAHARTFFVGLVVAEPVDNGVLHSVCVTNCELRNSLYTVESMENVLSAFIRELQSKALVRS